MFKLAKDGYVGGSVGNNAVVETKTIVTDVTNLLEALFLPQRYISGLTIHSKSEVYHHSW